MKTIKELVSSAKSGNKKSFDKLYEITHNDVWYNCLSFLKDEENAKDIMQETYITAFLKLDTLNDEQKFCGWITSIAVNKCKNKLKGKVEYQIDDEVLIAEAETDELMLPEEYITKAEKRKVLLQIMEDTLSFNQYQTVLMFYFDEMSISEIAQGLEISEGTVKSRLNSSRAKMKTAIEDYEKKSGDKLHGVVVVPFFTTIFKEEAKSLAVPNITIKLPNGQTLATSATKGF
ncbi:sigma-70 family RNA polymerase sigma factor, partial [Ruminococcus sp. AF43-11]